MEPQFTAALTGGILIGTSATLMLWLLGRIAGISGILAGCLQREAGGAWRYLFVLGLVLGPVLYYSLSAATVPAPSEAGLPMAAIAGLLVGYGTRLGSGCTSGHGVCGIARLSVRSITATAVFMLAGMVTVFVVGQLVQ